MRPCSPQTVKRLSVQFKDVHPNILQNPRHQRTETSQEWRTGRPESPEYNGQVARGKIPEKSGQFSSRHSTAMLSPKTVNKGQKLGFKPMN